MTIPPKPFHFIRTRFIERQLHKITDVITFLILSVFTYEISSNHEKCFEDLSITQWYVYRTVTQWKSLSYRQNGHAPKRTYFPILYKVFNYCVIIEFLLQLKNWIQDGIDFQKLLLDPSSLSLSSHFGST